MIKPTPKQIIAARLINPKVQYPTELFFGGAAGGAKSFFGCLWLLSMCTTYPESNFGFPVVYNPKSRAGQSFIEVAERLMGADLPIENPDLNTGFFAKLGRRLRAA